MRVRANIASSGYFSRNSIPTSSDCCNVSLRILRICWAMNFDYLALVYVQRKTRLWPTRHWSLWWQKRKTRMSTCSSLILLAISSLDARWQHSWRITSTKCVTLNVRQGPYVDGIIFQIYKRFSGNTQLPYLIGVSSPWHSTDAVWHNYQLVFLQVSVHGVWC